MKTSFQFQYGNASAQKSLIYSNMIQLSTDQVCMI